MISNFVAKKGVKMPKSNICVIGLDKNFTDDVCKQLSIRLDMFYANITELLEYELIDALKVENVCGKEYLIKEEISIIKRICSYENVLINIDYSNLNNDSTLQNIKNSCLIIYLQLTAENFKKEQLKIEQNANLLEINMDLFEDRNAICTKLCDIVVDCNQDKMEQIISNITEQIMWYYS